MKTIKYQMLLAAALVAGVAIGYFSAPAAAPSKDGTEAAGEAPRPGAIPPPAGHGDSAALRARIKELETRIAELSRHGADDAPQAPAAAGEGENRRGSPREWLERMKTENPERYVQMTNNFARWRQDRVNRAQAKLDFLASIDVSGMNGKARQAHEELQNLIVQRAELEESLHAEDLTDEDRRKIWQSLHENRRQTDRLNGIERRNLLGEKAKRIGLKGAEVREFSDTIQEIMAATDDGPGRRRGGGGR